MPITKDAINSLKQMEEHIKLKKQSPKREYGKPGTSNTYYVFVTENNGQITTTTISQNVLQQEKANLEKEVRERKIKSYYITKNEKEYQQFIKRIARQQQEESKQLRTQVRYPGLPAAQEQFRQGIEHLQEQFEETPREQRRPVEIRFPTFQHPRTHFYERQSPNYQESSEFSAQYVAPYRPVSSEQTKLANKPFRPGTTGQIFTPRPITFAFASGTFKPKFVRL